MRAMPFYALTMLWSAATITAGGYGHGDCSRNLVGGSDGTTNNLLTIGLMDDQRVAVITKQLTVLLAPARTSVMAAINRLYLNGKFLPLREVWPSLANSHQFKRFFQLQQNVTNGVIRRDPRRGTFIDFFGSGANGFRYYPGTGQTESITTISTAMLKNVVMISTMVPDMAWMIESTSGDKPMVFIQNEKRRQNLCLVPRVPMLAFRIYLDDNRCDVWPPLVQIQFGFQTADKWFLFSRRTSVGVYVIHFTDCPPFKRQPYLLLRKSFGAFFVCDDHHTSRKYATFRRVIGWIILVQIPIVLVWVSTIVYRRQRPRPPPTTIKVSPWSSKKLGKLKKGKSSYRSTSSAAAAAATKNRKTKV